MRQCVPCQQVHLKEIRALLVFFHHVSTGLFNKNKLPLSIFVWITKKEKIHLIDSGQNFQ